jgi:hypothetical protein
MRFGHWGMLEAGTQYKLRNFATMKHIQTPPKVNSPVNSRSTAGAQDNDNETWIQVGVPLARVLSKCAEAQWRQQLIEKAEAISRRSDIGAGEQVRQLCEAIHDGGEK